MSRYHIVVNEPNKIILVKGKPIRSPFVSVVSESEIKSIKSSIRSQGITNYEIKELNDGFEIESRLIQKPEIKKVLENKIVLNKPTEKVQNESLKKVDHEVPVQNNKLDAEVKIEELSTKGKGLLQTFLNYGE